MPPQFQSLSSPQTENVLVKFSAFNFWFQNQVTLFYQKSSCKRLPYRTNTLHQSLTSVHHLKHREVLPALVTQLQGSAVLFFVRITIKTGVAFVLETGISLEDEVVRPSSA